MNYGYYEEGFHPSLSGGDEDERYPIQLYHHTATQVDVSNSSTSSKAFILVIVKVCDVIKSTIALDISFDIWFVPMGKVIKFIKAKFLNRARILSHPITNGFNIFLVSNPLYKKSNQISLGKQEILS